MWIHRLSGTTILVITMIYSIEGIKVLHGRIMDSLHAILGLVILISVSFLALNGVCTRNLLN